MLVRPDGTTARAPAVVVAPTRRRLTNWMDAYLHYTNRAESADIYKYWVGLGTIAGAAQRKIFMETEYFFVHTNMYVVLVGPAGSKKSTAIRIGKRLLKGVPGIEFTTSAASVSALIKLFTSIPGKDHQSLTGYISELASILSISKEEMLDFLVDIYDGEPDWDKQTIAHDKEKIPFPWLNLMCGTTPAWLGQNFPKAAIEGGFVARTMFVYDDKLVLKSPFPKKLDEYKKLQRELVHDLAHISSLRFEFHFTPESQAWYEKWYLDVARFPSQPDSRTATYYIRKPYHLLKVAMALSLAESDSQYLETRFLERGLQVLAQAESRMKAAFGSVGANRELSVAHNIASNIRRNEGMSFGDVVAMHLHEVPNLLKLKELLEGLEAVGEIKRVVKNGGNFYFPGSA